MKKIRESTRQDIFELLLNGIEIHTSPDAPIMNPYYGNLSEIDFLKRIYDLDALPSRDTRFVNAEDDIRQHTINNRDYKSGWVFEDERFQLQKGKDEKLLNFLCAVFHSEVREKNECWKEFLDEINKLLNVDGYELYPESQNSRRSVYRWRKYSPHKTTMFIPFSQLNAVGNDGRKLDLSLNRKIRDQLYRVLEKHATIRVKDEKGVDFEIATSECVFRDLSQFYSPKHFSKKGNYIKTKSMKKFIMGSCPQYVFDAIELYGKYSSKKQLALQINPLLRLHSIPYKLRYGKLIKTSDASINRTSMSSISEHGLKELINEAQQFHNQNNIKIAVEKIWDAFERLKSYYSPQLNKAKSTEKIIEDMSKSEPHCKTMYEQEFRTLTDIGNSFRIRHHETTKIDIGDSRQYDYFYKRCIAIISTSLLYLEG